jgi:hypothetical protein
LLFLNEVAMSQRFSGFQLRRVRLGWLFVGCCAMFAAPVGAAPSASVAKPIASAATQKLATDAALRQGMANVASLLDKSWGDLQVGRLKEADATGLIRQVEAEAAGIVKNCQLDGRADRALHEILSDINQALLLIGNKKPDIQRSGGLALAQALRNYSRYFDHPGWAGPR